jgi:hypothetical protein
LTVGLHGLQVEEDPTGGKYAGAASVLNGAPHKLESIIQFHVGDVVTSLQRAVMQPGGQECIMYGTVMGAVGESQLADVPIRPSWRHCQLQRTHPFMHLITLSK